MTRSTPQPTASGSDDEETRIARVEEFARSEPVNVGALVDMLTDPSWVVRRSVVAALARVGEEAVDPLIDVLRSERDNETRLAAAVDALTASQGDVDQKLIALAETEGPPALVCDAVQVLGRRHCRAARPLLGSLVAHVEDNVAVAAIEALGRIGGIETLEPLIASVERKSFFRTFPALDALGRTGDIRAVRALVPLLEDPLYVVEALRALGYTGQEIAVAPIAQFLLTPGDALTRTAASALVDLRERYEARFGETEAILESLPAAVPAGQATTKVLHCMAGAGPFEVNAIARVLGWLGSEPAVAQLVELAAMDGPASAAAAEALRRLGGRAAGPLLAAIRIGDSARRERLLPLIASSRDSVADLVLCLDDPEPSVQIHACEALARTGDTSAVAALFRRIGDRDARVSQAAAAAIQSLGSTEARRIALQQARSNDPRTRRAALRIIAYFGYTEGLDVLVEAVGDEDEKIREPAIHGLALIDHPRALETLLAARTHPLARTRAAVARALGQCEASPDVVAALRAALEDDDGWVRYYACQSLGRLRVDAADDSLIARVDDVAGQVRVAAVEALARLRTPKALRALERAAGSEDPDMRRAALVGLGIARRAESVPLLRGAAGASDAPTRLIAISALAEFDLSEVVPVLAHAASDPDESVRSAAIGFLSTRPGADATKALIDQLSNVEARQRAIAALAVAPEERIEGVLAALEVADSEIAPGLTAALVRMRRPSSQAALAAVLSFENVAARRAAASALASLDTLEAREALAHAAAVDPDLEVRRISSTTTRFR